MTKPFEVRVRHQTDLATLDLSGEIDAFAEQDLALAYTEAESRNAATIALNFTAVDYMNSTGIALIVGLLAKARKSHRRVIVFGLSDHYTEIFQITRLSDFMDIYQDEKVAVQAVSSVKP